jgi:hypothetical protein
MSVVVRSGLARVLIEQLQFTGAESVPKDQLTRLKLNFNHPVGKRVHEKRTKTPTTFFVTV